MCSKYELFIFFPFFTIQTLLNSALHAATIRDLTGFFGKRGAASAYRRQATTVYKIYLVRFKIFD